MILKRFYDDALAQASWMVGCAATGEALVVDPNRDVDPYLAAAKAEGLRITHVTETHIHADFVSGARELADRTGATLYLSDEGGADWRYAYAAEASAVLVKDGDAFHVGNVRIDVLHTPGHTPEHLAFVVTDTAAADRPMGVFTGDFVFVGDVGRPDLLERAASYAGTMEKGARVLFASLQRFKERLPDYVQLWPGHGAGSACGKALGAVPQSTLGYEKLFNWGLAATDEEEFVRAVLAGQPEPPKYFARMKRINRDGPRVLGGFRLPPRMADDRLAAVIDGGAPVVDLRSTAEYASAHVPGTINVPLNRSFNTWAGWLLPYDRDVYLIVPDAEAADRAVRALAMIGLDRVAGFFTARAIESWRAAGRGTASVEQIDSRELAERMGAGAVNVLDVRGRAEWEAGHLPGVPNVPVGYLADRLDEIPTDRPLVLQCQGGARSSIAASVLRAHGFRDVLNLTGGFQDWVSTGHPVERGEPAREPAGVPGD
ncbi:MAG TPA: rhodanese-like domain-containing protein [Longimicrobium sp.]|nr:rhodanese-like domain-containing protein [Longimicrobium sp.]